MPQLLRPIQHRILFWPALAGLIGVIVGSASALFLAALSLFTRVRESHQWLVALLPVIGISTLWIYRRFGDRIEHGNNHLVGEIIEPTRAVPRRMALLVFVSTLASHLVGASVGREGTAVQMGGSLAETLGRPFGLSNAERRTLLMTGMAAGFSSVFGTPIAGIFFAFEICPRAIWKRADDSKNHLSTTVLAVLIAAIVANVTALAWLTGRFAWNLPHVVYPVGAVDAFSVAALVSVGIAALLFGILAKVFGALTRGLSAFVRHKFERVFLGSVILALLLSISPLVRYQGLGTSTIRTAFDSAVPAYDSGLKLLLTAFSLGLGFKGGEATPLFFMGATAGSALAHLLPVSRGLLAAIGFVAVFAGAAHLPVTSALIAVELFGLAVGPWALLACLISYWVNRRGKGLYSPLVREPAPPPDLSVR